MTLKKELTQVHPRGTGARAVLLLMAESYPPVWRDCILFPILPSTEGPLAPSHVGGAWARPTMDAFVNQLHEHLLVLLHGKCPAVERKPSADAEGSPSPRREMSPSWTDVVLPTQGAL